jgi:hypothetical protein
MGNLLRIVTGANALGESPEIANENKKIEAAKELKRVDSTKESRNVQVQPVCEMPEIESKIERDTAETERIQQIERDTVEIEIRISILKGLYYSTIHQVWESREIEFSKVDLDAIRRLQPHHFYAKTITAAGSDTLRPANEEVRFDDEPFSNLSENERNDADCVRREFDAYMCKFASFRTEYEIYSDDLNEHEDDTENDKSRKRKLNEIAIDGYANEVAEVNHLIPYSAKCAHFYAPLTEAAVGVNVEDDTTLSPAKKKLKQLVLVHGQYEQTTTDEEHYTRVHDTGIQHSLTNMVRVVAQKPCLDFKPSILIVPLLTLDETLKYDGGKYHVLVACTDPRVYSAIHMIEDYKECTEAEIVTATTTLASFVKAAAFTLQLADRDEISNKILNPQKRRILSIKDKFESSSRVKVPAVMTTTSSTYTKMRLAKMTLDMENPAAHQECDPFLLFVKAAVVWSSIQGQLLLPTSPPHDCEICLEDNLIQCDCDSYDPPEKVR